MDIPFTQPYWGKEESESVKQSLQHSIGVGDGESTKRMVKRLQQMLSIPFVLPVTSCTHGLELILASLGLKPNDEVILPSFTMTSTANAVVLAGARPVFADIEGSRYTVDPKDIERHITPHTKGIILVHYAGMPCFIEEILAITKKHHLFLVEDAAHAIGASYKGKPLGTFGIASAFSFHGTKNVCCGEGGVVVTGDASLAKKMEIYRANGTNRKDFLDGVVDKYSWVGKGSSYFLADILASIVEAQLKKIPEINRKRSSIASMYTKALKKFSSNIILPEVPKGAVPNWHIYGIRFHKKAHRDIFFTSMKQAGITVTSHYVPLHSSPMGLSCSKKIYHLPMTDTVAQTLVRLPIYPGLSKRQVQYIVKNAVQILTTLQ